MENLGNKINIKLVTNKKDYLKWTSKASYILQNIFNNNLVAICENEVTLTLNEPPNVECVICN